jgi:PAS domain S-box-containing protein
MWHEVTLKRATIDGEPRVIGFVRDVTERRSAEAALRASEEQYRAVFNATADGLVLRDADNRIVDVNPALLAMTGHAREELVGERAWAFLPPEMDAQWREFHRRNLAGESVQFETAAVRKDGTRFDVEVRCVPIQYRGRPHALAMARDITARKQAEAAVRASEEQYRAIFNASADALVLWNSELKRVDVNPAYERLYGFTREEVLNTAYPNHLPVEYVERRRELVRRTLAGESCQVELEALRSVTAASRTCWRSCATSPSASAPRRRSGRARSSTGRSSTRAPTGSRCATRSFGSLTSTPHRSR